MILKNIKVNFGAPLVLSAILMGFLPGVRAADDGSVVQYTENRIRSGELVPVLECDRGALTLYAESKERRHVTMVLRNHEMIEFFDSKRVFGGVDRISTQIYPDHSEAVFMANVFNGLFDGSKFNQLEGVYGGEYNVTYFGAKREAEGLKLTFDEINPFKYWKTIQQCEQRNELGECTIRAKPDHRDSNYYEKANWYFQDCR
jgi:hypothetical protein